MSVDWQIEMFGGGAGDDQLCLILVKFNLVSASKRKWTGNKEQYICTEFQMELLARLSRFCYYDLNAKLDKKPVAYF